MNSDRETPKRNRSRRVALAAILLAAIGTLSLDGCSRDAGVTPPGQRGGPRELAFILLNGGTWRLSEDRGRVVAVNLWATWCGPCRAETPLLEHVNADLAGQGFRVIGVSLDTARDREARVRGFQAAYHVTYPVAFPDPLSQIESGLEEIPTTLLFDRHGRAARVYSGELRKRSFQSDVLQLLQER